LEAHLATGPPQAGALDLDLDLNLGLSPVCGHLFFHLFEKIFTFHVHKIEVPVMYIVEG
jgi:hypothetical protein